jgi:hypothetical protein
MGRLPMLVDWQNQYCENGYTTKSNLVFNVLPTRIPMPFFTKIENSILKFIWSHKSSWITKAIPNKNSNAEDIKIPDFKLYYRVIAIKTACYWHKNRHEDQWNRTKYPEINLSLAAVAICYSGHNILWRKDSLINKWCW